MPSRLPFVVFLLMPLGCGPAAPAAKAPKAPPPVEVVRAQRSTVERVAKAIGVVETAATVALRPRVGGLLLKVLVKDGDAVRVGQPLFRIDPEPYRVALEQTQALLEKDKAALAAAEAQNRRLEELSKSGTAAAEDLDVNRATLRSLQAGVRAGAAGVKAAELRLSYCDLAAPLAGRVGDVFVDEGNLLQADQPQALAVINQIDPIEASFAVPQKLLAAVRAAQAAGPVKVTALLPEKGAVMVGTLTAIDNQADPTTGTIRLKATFRNPDGRLVPGVYLEVSVTLGQWVDVVLMPPGAVQSGQRGEYAYVVGKDDAIALRELAVADETDAGIVVAKGLQEGDRVVTNGHLRAAPGMKVAPKPSGGEAPKAAAKVGAAK